MSCSTPNQIHARLLPADSMENDSVPQCIVFVDLCTIGHTTGLIFVTKPRNLTTNHSSRVVFECSVCSKYTPTFAWKFTRRGSMEAQTIDSLLIDYSITPTGPRTQVLIITSAEWRHEGVYTCAVSSENHQIQVQASLNIPSKSIV